MLKTMNRPPLKHVEKNLAFSIDGNPIGYLQNPSQLVDQMFSVYRSVSALNASFCLHPLFAT